MCEPTTIIMGAALLAGGIAKYQDAQNQAALAEQQAKMKDIQSGDALLRGQAVQGVMNIKTGQEMSDQTLAYAGAGVDTTSGTPVEVAGQTAMFGKLESLNAENDAIREAWGYKTEASVLRSKAAAERQRGQNELIASVIGAGAQGYAGYSKGIKVKPGTELASTGGVSRPLTIDEMG